MAGLTHMSPRVAETPRVTPPPALAGSLEERIRRRSATVGVVGQGYVGFSVAQRAAEIGFPTVGIDIHPGVVRRSAQESRFDAYRATDDPAALRSCDVIIIAVPTPTRLDERRRCSDLSILVAAVKSVAEQIEHDERPRLLVVESTYAPGTTRNVVMPLVDRGPGAGRISVGYSPERVDPGNGAFTMADIPKVTSGIDDVAARLTELFYEQLVRTVVPASSVEAAEATKLLENTFRYVNIAFAQEFDEYCHALNLRSHEVTRLAATKPFGFLPFLAGAGVGGHCIAEDPYFLHDSMEVAGVANPLLSAAMANHEARAAVVVHRIAKQLGGHPLHGARILLLGVTYKPNVADTRRSPALPVLLGLEQLGAVVDYHDPHIPAFADRESVDLAAQDAGAYDLAVLLVEHNGFDAAAMHRAGWRVYRLSEEEPDRDDEEEQR